jgi:hypothetical protein
LWFFLRRSHLRFSKAQWYKWKVGVSCREGWENFSTRQNGGFRPPGNKGTLQLCEVKMKRRTRRKIIMGYFYNSELGIFGLIFNQEFTISLVFSKWAEKISGWEGCVIYIYIYKFYWFLYYHRIYGFMFSILLFNSLSYLFLLLCLCILIVMYVLFCILCFHRANWHSSATLTEDFPCFSFRCKANARV